MVAFLSLSKEGEGRKPNSVHTREFAPTWICSSLEISADISRDEQIHVGSNSLVCAELGLSPSPSLDRLRKATIHWILEPLGTNTYDKYLDKKFWLDASDRLMYEGKGPELSDTKSARMPAFFEHSNVNLPQYA